MKNTSLYLLLIIYIPNIRVECSFASTILCARVPGLSLYQRKLCTDASDAFVALGAGHSLGAEECQHQFSGHRWNCSQVWRREAFGHVVILGSREAAFTYAISSAGAVYSITAACTRGNISLCGCDPKHRHSTHKSNAWKWSGCSADIQFGMKFARKFLDAREIEGDDRSLMNLHNNRAGRKIVKKLLKTECKCHGVSGSCAMKTCWKILPPFRLIGEILMKKYKKVRNVHTVNERNGLTLVLKRRNRALKGPKKVKIKQHRPKRMELVYLQPSPSYCERDVAMGSLGTAGRQCNRTEKGIGSCDLLCCGRGYHTHQINRTWQCQCQFQWCCQVQCEICHESKEEYVCK